MPVLRWMDRTCKSSLQLPATWPTRCGCTLLWACHGDHISTAVHEVPGQAGRAWCCSNPRIAVWAPLAQVPITSGANSSHCLLHVAPLCAALSVPVLLLTGNQSAKLLGIEAVSSSSLQRGMEMLCRRSCWPHWWAIVEANYISGASTALREDNHYNLFSSMSTRCLFAPQILFESLPMTTWALGKCSLVEKTSQTLILQACVVKKRNCLVLYQKNQSSLEAGLVNKSGGEAALNYKSSTTFTGRATEASHTSVSHTAELWMCLLHKSNCNHILSQEGEVPHIFPGVQRCTWEAGSHHHPGGPDCTSPHTNICVYLVYP